MNEGRDSQGGFTMGELMAGVAVAAITMSLAVPGLISVTQRNEQAATVSQLASSLYLARSEAIKRNDRVAVCPSSDGKNCQSVAWDQGWIVFSDHDLNGRRSSAELLIEARRGPFSPYIVSADFSDSISFQPGGGVAGGESGYTGRFAFCAGEQTDNARVLIVGPGGRPRLADISGQDTQSACRGAGA